MYKKVLSVVMGITMSVSMVGAQNARMQALGNPNIGMTNLINDISDVITYPSEVVANKDVVHGALGNIGANTTEADAALPGYVYASKSVMDMFAVGFLFGKPSYVNGYTLSGNAPRGFIDWTNAGYTDFRSAAVTELGNTFLPGALPAINNPTNAAHLLIGADVGGMKFGLDLFNETDNSSSTNETITGTNKVVVETKNNIGAMGAIAGLALDLGTFTLKSSAGFVNFSLLNENINKANITTKQIFAQEAGMLIPVSGKISMEMGSNLVTAGVDFSLNNAQFKATNDNGTTVNDVITAKYSNTFFSAGIADEIDLGSNTKLIAALAYIHSSTKTTPETSLVATDPEGTQSTTILPALSLGIEHRINNVWKTDAIILRAGGAKIHAQDKASSNWNGGGSEGTTENTTAPVTSAFSWSTGCTIEKGDLALDMVVNPGSWNGVDFLNSRGPITGNITLTYYFGNNSSNADSYDTPAYDEPTEDATEY